MTLMEIFAEALADLDDVEASEPRPGTVEWSVRGRPFATVTSGTAQFRLDPDIGKAALGTPNAIVSARGPEWIAFGPPELDRFAIDRATAWLGSAYRLAAES